MKRRTLSFLAAVAGLTLPVSNASAAPAAPAAWAQAESAPRARATDLRVGHWVRIKGGLDEHGVFRAATVEVREPDKYESLIGTVPEDDDRRGRIVLLGQEVHLSSETHWDDLEEGPLGGVRIEVEGRYRGPQKFSARDVRKRSPGRDRIEGRLDAIGGHAGELELRVMNFFVRLPRELELENEGPVGGFELAAERIYAPGGGTSDDDDEIDDTLSLGPVRIGGLIEWTTDREQDFDLDDAAARDRTTHELAVRLRAIWEPTDDFTALAEVRHVQQWRDDDQDGGTAQGTTRLGEAFGYWRDLGGSGFDLQVGRQDFDDPREWIYDQNLDAVRLIRTRPEYRLELSASTTLFDGSPFDEAADNFVAYASNNDRRRHLAAYVVHREVDLSDEPQSLTHLGARAIGDWIQGNESWIDLAHVTGTDGAVDVSGWGLDVGTVWNPGGSPWSWVAGYALGTGDSDPDDGKDHSFRQTGLQDNTAKVGGETSIRYYGELLEPELSNLGVLTLGVTRQLGEDTSLSLLLHHYEQMRGASFLRDTNLDMDPSGIDPFLGWEADLILGSRRFDGWTIELVASAFEPGAAFADDADTAFLGKLQVRRRF